MRLTQKTLDTLPTVRLYIGEKSFYTVPYMNARRPLDVPLDVKDFKPNGKGLPWICGISNAIMRQKEIFDHPVFYAHTIGSVVYVVAMTDKGGLPKFAYRYSHRGGSLIEAYDESRKDPRKWRKFVSRLEDHPSLRLEKGRTQSAKGAHSPGMVSGHLVKGAPHGDKNKIGLKGAKRRAVAAGFIPEGLSI